LNKICKALVLGGTNPHIALIKNLQKRGYHTILIDYLENPPARSAADEHIRESTLDKEKVLEIARNTKADIVISTCIDQANVTACFVAEKLGLPAPYSYETALKVTNKLLMKQEMLENGIPTSQFVWVDDACAHEIGNLAFPVVVKPADTTGSAGVRKADSTLELKEYLVDALNRSRTSTAIVEEFKKGVEVSLDCFVKDAVAHILLIRQKFPMKKLVHSVLQSPGSMAPADISQEARAKLIRIASSIARVFRLNNTPLLIQALIDKDDINIIEFAARIGGGLSYRTVELATGFDILNSAVESYLGTSVSLAYGKCHGFYSTNIIYGFPGKFDRAVGYRELIDNNIIEEFYYYKTPGMEISSDMSTGSRVGAFIVKAESMQEMRKKMKLATERLQVYDVEGRALMRKDLFKF